MVVAAPTSLSCGQTAVSAADKALRAPSAQPRFLARCAAHPSKGLHAHPSSTPLQRAVTAGRSFDLAERCH